MSKATNVIIVSPPMFLQTQASESVIMKGFNCTVCNGNGWLWDNENRHDHIKKDCPFCKGAKKIVAKVTIEWESETNKDLIE